MLQVAGLIIFLGATENSIVQPVPTLSAARTRPSLMITEYRQASSPVRRHSRKLS